MFIQTEDTPNPETIKFLPGRNITTGGPLEFTNEAEAVKSPLAQKLFAIDGVKSVFFGSDFISITKQQENAWFTLKPHILSTLVNYLAAHEVLEIRSDESEENDYDAISKEIIELLDSKIRPAVAMDGGDIVFQKFEDGVVYLKMKGACSGCPSSTITLKSGIENMLRYYIPEVQEVRSIE